MDRKVLAGIGVLLVVLAGFFTLNLGVLTSPQSDLKNIGHNANMQSCKETRRSMCVDGEITESDYPDSCFENGENILENPYQCPQ